MVTVLRVLLLIVFLAGIMEQGCVFAQDDDTLGGLKTRIDSLLKENADLEARYQSLQEELVALQRTVNQYKKEMKDFNEQQRSLLFKELEDIDLKKDLQGLKGPQRLWLLQLYDLRYQKKELELELEWREFLYQQAQEKEDLIQRIIAMDKENQDLEARISGLQRKTKMLEK